MHTCCKARLLEPSRKIAPAPENAWRLRKFPAGPDRPRPFLPAPQPSQPRRAAPKPVPANFTFLSRRAFPSPSRQVFRHPVPAGPPRGQLFPLRRPCRTFAPLLRHARSPADSRAPARRAEAILAIALRRQPRGPPGPTINSADPSRLNDRSIRQFPPYRPRHVRAGARTPARHCATIAGAATSPAAISKVLAHALARAKDERLLLDVLRGQLTLSNLPEGGLRARVTLPA